MLRRRALTRQARAGAAWARGVPFVALEGTRSACAAPSPQRAGRSSRAGDRRTTTVVARLKAADAHPVRPTHDCDGLDRALVYGATKNPVDETRSPGGSSGGCAAAVVGRCMAPASARWPDTGGSIRQPASVHGLLPASSPRNGRASLRPRRLSPVARSDRAFASDAVARARAPGHRRSDERDATSLTPPMLDLMAASRTWREARRPGAVLRRWPRLPRR